MPNSWGLIFLLFLGTFSMSLAQDDTPIAKYDFANDSGYQKALSTLKTQYSTSKHSKLLDSIAKLAFLYKDWETAHDYSRQLVEVAPSGMGYFRLGGAAGFRSLEVARIFSLPYVSSMRVGFEKAAELLPDFIPGLRAQVNIYTVLPALIGGDLEKAKEYASRIEKRDPVEGALAFAYIEEQTNHPEEARRYFQKAFDILKGKEGECTPQMEAYLMASRRNLAYNLGRAAAVFQIESTLGACLLRYFLSTYSQNDTVPKSWVIYRLAQIANTNKDGAQMQQWIDQALKIDPKFSEILELKKKLAL
jgi:tetratricopeptide (TPR) repeat protein